MATYRQGPYIVEEGYAMVDQDGDEAHRHTFADTADESIALLRGVLGFDEYEAQSDLWRPAMAVRITDTNIDYRARGGRTTVIPWGVWERYGSPYIP